MLFAGAALILYLETKRAVTLCEFTVLESAKPPLSPLLPEESGAMLLDSRSTTGCATSFAHKWHLAS
jgi:hypothetical protein